MKRDLHEIVEKNRLENKKCEKCGKQVTIHHKLCNKCHDEKDQKENLRKMAIVEMKKRRMFTKYNKRFAKFREEIEK